MGETMLTLLDWIACAAIFAVGYLCGREARRDVRYDPPPGADRPIYIDHTHGGDADGPDDL